jgi:hypothetical protein
MSNEVPGRASSGVVVGLIVVGVIARAGAGVGFLSYVNVGHVNAKLAKAEARIGDLEKRMKKLGGEAAGTPATPARRKGKGNPATGATTKATTKPATAPAAAK